MSLHPRSASAKLEKALGKTAASMSSDALALLFAGDPVAHRVVTTPKDRKRDWRRKP